jgi:hypothetical protein
MLLRLARLALLDEFENEMPRGERTKASRRIESVGVLTAGPAV